MIWKHIKSDISASTFQYPFSKIAHWKWPLEYSSRNITLCFKIKVVFTPSSYNVSASCIITYNSSEMFDRVLNMAMIHFLKKCSTFCNISPLHCLSGTVECIPHWCNPVYTPFFYNSKILDGILSRIVPSSNKFS